MSWDYNFLIENMNDGILVLDDKDRVIAINPAAESILASPANSTLGKPISVVLASWGSFLQSIQQGGDLQIEILSREEKPHYYDLHINSLCNNNQEPLGRIFAFRDVTQYREAEDQLAHQNEELKIVEKISLAITSGLDMQKTIQALHEQCSHIAPIDLFYVALYDEARSLISVPLHYEHGRYQNGTLRDINVRPGTIGEVIRTRKTVYLKDNMKAVTGPLNPNPEVERRARSYIGIPLLVRDKVVGVMSIQNYRPNAYKESQVHMLERISIQAAVAIENARLYAEEQRLAIIDELTGIYNYRGLLEIGAREVERARRFNHPLSILFFDIDDFRNFNNTYSHSTGNIVLRALVKNCHAILRSVDIFTRFGGDEFVAILPETDLASAEEVARRIVKETAASRIPTPYGELSITVSIGVAMLTASSVDLAELIERANKAEHRAKQGQKSIVVISE